MSGADTLRFKAKNWMMSQPGKRGIDIPEYIYDRIYQAAVGITQPMWGRFPTGEQMQHFYDQGIHTPDQIRDAYGKLPHPHAQGLTVEEYPQYADAFKTYRENQ